MKSKNTKHTVNMLHISDIHIFSSTTHRLMMMRMEKLPTQFKPDFIVVTGDYRHLVYNRSFDAAIEYLNQISQIFNIDKKDFYLVPGNHDVYTQEKEENETEHGRGLNKMGKILNEAQDNPDISADNIHFLKKSLSDYSKFVRDFYDNSIPENDSRIMCPEDVLCISREKMNIILLNTALASCNDAFGSNKEVIDMTALSSLKLTNNNPSIVIAHHSPDCLIDSQRKIITNVLVNLNTCVYLCGDAHRISGEWMPKNCISSSSFPCFTCGTSAANSYDDWSDIGVIGYSWDFDTSMVSVKVFEYQKDDSPSYPQGFEDRHKYYTDGVPFSFPMRKSSMLSTGLSNTKSSHPSKTSGSVKKDLRTYRHVDSSEIRSPHSIWLPDAEKADGTQTRFEAYSKVGAVNDYIPNNLANDTIWGISSVKGAGKTFLLQVKRLKVSKKYDNLPHVTKPGPDNKWATDTITSIQPADIYGYSVHELADLWTYCIECYVINSALVSLKKKRNKTDLGSEIDSIYQSLNSLTPLTKKIINYEGKQDNHPALRSLDVIMQLTLSERTWQVSIKNDSVQRQICISSFVNILHKKSGYALFIDKIDQFIRVPNTEDPPECSDCDFQNGYEACTNPNKSHDYCLYQCNGGCCMSCQNFSDSTAGTKIRVANINISTSFGHVNYWQYFQISLAKAAFTIKHKYDGKIRVYFTIREEALNCEDNLFTDSRGKIYGIIKHIYYDKASQETIFYDSIRNEPCEQFLMNPELKSINPELAFVGTDALCHPYVFGKEESVFNSIYRHSFDRARDIQEFGKALAEKIPELKALSTQEERSERVKRIIEDTAALLLYVTRGESMSYYEEKMVFMPRYWKNRDHFVLLLQNIDRNLLFDDDISRICAMINRKKGCNTVNGNCDECMHHPFSFLYNIGLLGIITYNQSHDDPIHQAFLKSNEITYFYDKDTIHLAGNPTCYVVHPSLTKAAEKFWNTNIHHFRGFILGRGQKVDKQVLKQLFSDKHSLTKEEFLIKYYS